MLLDTHVLLWLMKGDPLLGPDSRETLEAATDVLVSAASVWEIAIKADLGRLEVPDDLVEQVTRSGLLHLAVTTEHTWAIRQVTGLPHRDPFDRLLVAQAGVLDVPMMTADRALLEARPTWDGRAVRLLDARL